tara:strand:+ start:1512 stop:1754 length:243 start_codon:yes stop_codon:yes gene_type:complete
MYNFIFKDLPPLLMALATLWLAYTASIEVPKGVKSATTLVNYIKGAGSVSSEKDLWFQRNKSMMVGDKVTPEEPSAPKNK